MTPECEDLVKLMQINAKSDPASLFKLYNEKAASKIGDWSATVPVAALSWRQRQNERDG